VPRVSVVIPTWNRSAELAEAIASVRAQSFDDWECIVADDGSPDDTAAIVDEVVKRDHRVRYLHQENQGAPGATRNFGVTAAKSDLIAFLDDDDLWLPGKLAAQVALMDAEPDVGLSFTRCQRFGGDDGAWPDPPVSEQPTLEELIGGNIIPCSSVIVRRDVLERAGPFDTQLRFGEDFELWLRIARIAPLRYLSDIHLRYRVHPGGISTNLDVELAALGEIYDRARGWGVPETALRRPMKALHKRRAAHAGGLLAALPHWWRWCTT